MCFTGFFFKEAEIVFSIFNEFIPFNSFGGLTAYNSWKEEKGLCPLKSLNTQSANHRHAVSFTHWNIYDLYFLSVKFEMILNKFENISRLYLHESYFRAQMSIQHI